MVEERNRLAVEVDEGIAGIAAADDEEAAADRARPRHGHLDPGKLAPRPALADDAGEVDGSFDGGTGAGLRRGLDEVERVLDPHRDRLFAPARGSEAEAAGGLQRRFVESGLRRRR